MADIKIKKMPRGWLGGKTELKVSSPYGRRNLKLRGSSKFHAGIDIAIPQDTPIYSPVNGSATSVVQKSNNKIVGAGLYVKVTSGNFSYWFMHLSSTPMGESGSKSVKIGDIIGYTGGTPGHKYAGTSTGAHLHFEIRKSPHRKRVDAFNPVIAFSDKLISKAKGNVMSDENKKIPLYSAYETEESEEKDKQFTFSEQSQNESNETDISDQTVVSETEEETEVETELKDELAKGIWQITKLVMDADVANLRIFDAATSIQTGSLINFFNKVCQKPFVEFFGDTFGDQYYFMVRKPPFDKEGMKKTLATQGLYQENKTTQNTSTEENKKTAEEIEINPYVIHEDDIINSNLMFGGQEIYSWYQFIPIYEMASPSELEYIIPAILFPEYAAIWGSRECIIRSQYRHFIDSDIRDDYVNENKSNKGSEVVRRCIHDIHYLIESNAYSPFTRRGTITVIGNRKIKRGTFIRIWWEQGRYSEIFYVDSVTQNYSISDSSLDRTTTLQLSRGMIEEYMFVPNSGEDVVYTKDGGKNASYFNIINFGDYDKKKDSITMNDWREVISSWKVNINIFKFFLRKLQFISMLSNRSKEVAIISKSN